MTRIGIHEFKEKATALLSSGETLVIEWHGKTIGFYIPVEAKDRSTGLAALEDLENTVNSILDRKDITEQELLDANDR